MSDENVGGLVELLPCPFCGEPPKASAPWMFCGDVKQIASCNGTDSKPHELISMESHRWNARALSAHGQPVVDAHLVERILNTRVPGGSLVWWSINGGGMGIDDGHRNVVRRVLEAYLSMKGATP